MLCSWKLNRTGKSRSSIHHKKMAPVLVAYAPPQETLSISSWIQDIHEKIYNSFILTLRNAEDKPIRCLIFTCYSLCKVNSALGFERIGDPVSTTRLEAAGRVPIELQYNDVRTKLRAFLLENWRRINHSWISESFSDEERESFEAIDHHVRPSKWSIQGRSGSTCREICVNARGKATLRNLFNFRSQQSFCTDSAVSEKFACTWIQYTTVRPHVYILMLLHNNMDAIPPCSNCTFHSHLLSRSTHTRTSPVRRTCLNPREERACVILWQRCEHSTLSSSRLSTIDTNVILRASVFVSTRSLHSLLTLHALDILLDRNHVPYIWIIESYTRRRREHKETEG